MSQLDKYGFDHSQDGQFVNMKTKKVVVLDGIRHYKDSTGRIEAHFKGVRNGNAYGRAFSTSIEDFFQRYAAVL